MVFKQAHTLESREKIRQGHLGKKFSEEHKKKIGNANRGKKGQIAWNKGRNFWEGREHPRGMFGKHHSKENREALSKIKLRNAAFNYAKKTCHISGPNIGHNEKQILDAMEKEIGYRIIRQFEVEGYFVDGYIPQLNLVIEVDEKYHLKNQEKDMIRQIIIKNKLNCDFMRVKDF